MFEYILLLWLFDLISLIRVDFIYSFSQQVVFELKPKKEKEPDEFVCSLIQSYMNPAFQ